MSEEASPFTVEQRLELGRLRLGVGVAIACCALMPVAAVVALGGMPEHPTQAQRTASYVAIAVFVVSVVLGISRRMQAYKAHWLADVVTPAGYRKGVRWYVGGILFGMGAATAIGLWVGSPAAPVDLAVFAIALLVLGFPDGKPMLPQPPEFGEK